MTAELLHPLWTPPGPDATALQKAAHALMLRTLKRIAKRIPEVLYDPAKLGWKPVMEAATAALLNPRLVLEPRTEALTLLQRRLQQVDPSTPQQLYSARVDKQGAIAADFGDAIKNLGRFETALHTCLVSLRPTRRSHSVPDKNPKPSTNESDPADALLALGVLVALLVTRLGYCSMSLLAKIVASVGERPLVLNGWAWVDITLAHANNAPQLRRIFLDAVTLAAWLRAQGHFHLLRQPPGDAKAGQRASFYTSMAKRAFKTMLDHMEAAGRASPFRSLPRLCSAKVQRLRLTTMPLLGTFAKGDIVNSSLEAGTWQRLLGRRSPMLDEPVSPTPPVPASHSEAPPPLPSDVFHKEDATVEEQAAQGDLDETGVVARLRLIMAGKRSTWRDGFDTLLMELRDKESENQTARCVVGWLRHLACEHKSKGRLLHDGSVRGYRGLLANRLLQYMPPNLAGIDEEELEDAYNEVVASRSSKGQGGRIQAALGSFNFYVRMHEIPELPHVRLAGIDREGYSISSRIVSEAEFAEGLEQIDHGDIVIESRRLKVQMRAFWVLAFRFGMRRQEILGLQARDIDPELVRVRENEARSLKTPNAHRVLPLGAVPEESERALILALIEGRNPDDYVFFGEGIPSEKDLGNHPVVPKINDLFKRLTGDAHLHPHNLRHSLATLFLFGSLGSDLELGSHPSCTPWMRTAIEKAQFLEAAIAGELHRKAGRGSALAMTMGHSSELTTYEHYVHSLDLLLFLACTHPSVRLWGTEPAYRRQVRDRAQIRALLGHADSYRLPHAGAPGTIIQIAERHPNLVLMLKTDTGQDKKTGKTAAPPWPMSLQGLRRLPKTKKLSGCPEKQFQVDAVMAVLSRLQSVDASKREDLRAVIVRWVQALPKKHSDWAYMKAAAARDWVRSLAALDASIPVEVLHVTRKEDGNVKRKVVLAKPLAETSYKDGGGRYWIRFASTRKRPARRTRRTDQRRSRAQSSITWLMFAILEATASPQLPLL